MFFSKKLKKLNVRHCFFSRNSGFSGGIYRSLNCGIGSNDNKKLVLKNIKFVESFLNIKKNNLKLMYQTHSSKILKINHKNLEKKKYKSDGITSDLKGVALGVLTADCVPILMYDKINKKICVLHAGWKGIFKGIVEKGIKKFSKKNLNSLIVAIGPCIGKKSYEVDKLFKLKFLRQSKYYKKFFKPSKKGKFLFDLRSIVNYKLKKAGVKEIDNVNLDTFKDSKNFFSHRRSKQLKEPDYGRCLSVITL